MHIVRMLTDINGNVRGELAGFEQSEADALVARGAAELVLSYDPRTQVFDPSTLTVSARVEPAPQVVVLPGTPLEADLSAALSAVGGKVLHSELATKVVEFIETHAPGSTVAP
jgi:hypothetical protein